MLIHGRLNGRPDWSFHQLESETQPYLELNAVFGHGQLPVHTVTSYKQPIALPSRGQGKLSIQVLGNFAGTTSRLLDTESVATSYFHTRLLAPASILV